MLMTIQSLVLRYAPSSLQKVIEKIKASPLGYRLARGVFWSMTGAVVSRGLMLTASILVARILGREVFGEFGMVRSTVGMFLVFAGFGLGLTATKHVAELRKTDPARAGRIMGLSSIFAAVTGFIVAFFLWVFAPWLAAHTINAPHLAGVLRIGALILFVNALNGAQTGALAGFEAFRAIARVNLWVGLASFPLLVGGACFGGLVGAVWALAANMAIHWLLNHIALREQAATHLVPFSLRGCTTEWPVLLKFSLPAALSGVMVTPAAWACNAILVNQPDGYGQMGIFDAANQWRLAILFIPGMVGQIVLPMLSSLNNPDHREDYLKVLKMNLLINGGTALLAALPIAFSASWIMRSYGARFEEGEWVLIVLTLSAVLVAINNVVGQAIASRGQMWIGLLFNTIWAVALVTLTVTLVRYQGHGAIGLALSNLGAYSLHCIWQYSYLWHLRKTANL